MVLFDRADSLVIGEVVIESMIKNGLSLFIELVLFPNLIFEELIVDNRVKDFLTLPQTLNNRLNYIL